jgi:hypothetical protein
MNLQAFSHFRQFRLSSRTRRLLGSLIGSIALGSVGIGSGWALPTSSGQSIAQTDPNTGYTGIQVPSTAVTPTNGKVTIHFINETGASIDYQVIGDTQYRSLAGRSEMTLQNLKIPTTFTFRRNDNGFLDVKLYPNSPTAGTLTVRVHETADFTADRTSIYVDQTGGVFLN